MTIRNFLKLLVNMPVYVASDKSRKFDMLSVNASPLSYIYFFVDSVEVILNIEFATPLWVSEPLYCHCLSQVRKKVLSTPSD